jgi:hypothetical protein
MRVVSCRAVLMCRTRERQLAEWHEWAQHEVDNTRLQGRVASRVGRGERRETTINQLSFLPSALVKRSLNCQWNAFQRHLITNIRTLHASPLKASTTHCKPGPLPCHNLGSPYHFG